jgi:hypothetical protein
LTTGEIETPTIYVSKVTGVFFGEIGGIGLAAFSFHEGIVKIHHAFLFIVWGFGEGDWGIHED